MCVCWRRWSRTPTPECTRWICWAVRSAAQVVDQFNATAVDYGPAATLVELFEAQVDRSPSAEAVRFEDTSWSYAELDERANRIAHRLARAGAQPDAVVAVCMERSADRVAALYGVLKSGAAYLPLEADLPADRIAQILDEAAPVAVLCSEATIDLLPVAERHPLWCRKTRWPQSPVIA